MKAGTLKEKIELYAPDVVTTEFGDSKINYELCYTTRAFVKYNSGSRVNENNEVFYPNSKTFIVRYYVPIAEPMRIKYEDKFYQVISVNKDQKYNNKVIDAELVNE